jgi:putative ABC transport system permease protein
MGTLFQDVRFALRSLRRLPAFTIAAIATLALGVGATTAIFSTVNAAVLKPLPYPAPEDLYGLRTALTDGRVTTGLLAPSEIVRLNDPSLSIVKAAGVIQQDATFLRDDGVAVKAAVYAATDAFFDVFGLPMTLGGVRSDQVSDNNGPPPAVVISYRIWRDVYNSDPAIVGKPIRFAEAQTTIGGVAPRSFDTPHGADFWFMLRPDPQGVNHSFDGYMRVKPGTTVERVRAEMATVMAGLQRDLPQSTLNRIYVVRPLVDSIIGDLGPILLIVLSATGLLLILACVNVTNLLLARGAARAREMAVRIALGAGRGRIVRQLLTESLLLAVGGALLGLGLAYAGVQLLLRVGAAKLPRLDAVPFDTSVLLFALGALFVCGVLVGFAPALRLARTDVKTLMNESGRSQSGGRGTERWLSAMTVAEIALAVTLVAGAGWLIRSFASLNSTDPGFDPERRVVFDISLQGPKFRDNAAVSAATDDLFTRLRAIPGVSGVGSTTNFPLKGGQESSLYLELQGETLNRANPRGSRQRNVTPGFFDAMGMRILAGRDFQDTDRPSAAADAARVAIVNRTFVERHLKDRNPIDVRFQFGYPNIDPRSEVAIVGVVESVRQKSLVEAPEPAFYLSSGQLPFALRRQTVVVRTTLENPSVLQPAIRDEVRKLDPQMAVDFEMASNIVGDTLRRQRVGMTLMLLFGATAVVLAMVGIYGVIAYAVSQRRNEVATRLALGATPGTVFWLVVKRGRTLAAIGAVAGLAIAYALGRVAAASIYEMRAADPMILGGAVVLMVAVALVATMVPAWRASRLNPARTLRSD